MLRIISSWIVSTVSQLSKINKVVLVLLIGLVCPELAGANFMKSHVYPIDFVFYKTVIGFIYITGACIGFHLAKIELSRKRKWYCLLIGVLSCCMLVSASFNLVMINTEWYNALTYYKNGENNPVSWAVIYKGIELGIMALMVINGFYNIPHMDTGDPIGYKNANWRDTHNNQSKF